jgi:hypothetical protein
MAPQALIAAAAAVNTITNTLAHIRFDWIFNRAPFLDLDLPSLSLSRPRASTNESSVR